MAKRASLDDKLSEVRQLRDQDPGPEVTAELRKALADRSNLVVAAAAAIVGDRMLGELATAMEAAFPRFLEDPLKTDKLCRAKLAIVQALDKLEHAKPDVFFQAARHVQLEPVWGGSEDTAVLLRAAGLLALARIDPDGLLEILVDALADPKKDVRLAAAQALGYHGSEAANLLLRLKVRLGDPESEVFSECLSGLLACSPKENLPLVTEFLDPDNELICEAAILALGRSRLSEAFDVLVRCWDRKPSRAMTQTLLFSLAMLRQLAATDFLVELVRTGPEATALEALAALKLQAHDPRLLQRVEETVRGRELPALRARFDQDFSS
jgi:HEAT repeat protein